MTTRRRLPLVLVVAGVLRAGDALACGVLEGNGASWVDGADVIVRARAVEQKGRKLNTLEEARKAGGRLGTTVAFERLEALKGRAPATLEFEGEFVEWADGNDPILPYTMVRKGGRGGNCFARNYAAGAEYLLMLKVRDGVLTPYWASAGATNELIAGPHDPWLRWVRAHLELRRQNPALAGTMPAYCPDDMDLFPEKRCGFALGQDRFDIDGFGVLRRVGRSGPRETRFTLPGRIHVDNVSAAVIDGDLLLEQFSFNTFERPVVGPEEVVFRESTASARPPRSIRVVKISGAVLSNR